MITTIKPKISVIIPVYNVEKYLTRCLDSVINQTFPDIEIICIDDGSTDNCLQILDEYAKNDERIIVISQENQGPGVARNMGLEIAKGEYISFVDPDDWVSFNFLESLYCEAKKSDYDIVKGHKIYVPELNVYKEESLKNLQVKKHNKINYHAIANSYWTCIYKNSLIKEFNIKFAPTYVSEDIAFYNKFFLLAQNYSTSIDAKYFAFNRPNSLTKCKESRSRLRYIQRFEASIDRFNFINSSNIPKEKYVWAINRLFGTIRSCYISLFLDGFDEMLPDLRIYLDFILENLKYKKCFKNDETFKILKMKNFNYDMLCKVSINKKLKSLSLIKKLLYFGSYNNYKIVSILGLRFIFKRARA